MAQHENSMIVTSYRVIAVACLISFLTAMGLAGCDLLSKSSVPSQTETPIATTVPRPTAPSMPAYPPPAPTVSSTTGLTIWTTEAFFPTQDTASGQLLAEQWQAFEEAHPNVKLQYILKKPHGKGGILNFLKTASVAAPTVLPDLVILDTLELKEAAQAELIQPLDDLISSEVLQDLFPFARHSPEGQLVGLQFEADVEHLIYNTNKIENPPTTWRDVLSGGATYIFPAGGKGELVNDAFMIQYLAAGGQVLDKSGKPALDKNVLVEVLQFYKDCLEAGVVPVSVLEFEDLEDCWGVYVSAQAAMSNVSSAKYLANRSVLKNTSFAAIPTRDGNVATLSKGWALAIVTDDPSQQAIAAQFIEWLLTPQNNAKWNLAAGHLPTRKAAFEYLGIADPYFPFARQQLENVHPRPMGPAYEKISRALQRAVQDVLKGEASPQEAAEAVIAVLGQ